MIRAVLMATLLMLASKAEAQIRGHIDACSLSAQPLPFGTFTGDRIDTTGTLQLTCTGSGNNNPFTVTLSQGISNSFIDRTMLIGGGGPGRELHYNLYIDAARRTIWGNGQGETRLQTGQLQFQGGRPQTATFSIFGRLERQQLPSPGAYADQIIVTLTF